MTGSPPDPRPSIVDEGTSALDDDEIEVVHEEISEIPAQTLLLDTRAASDAARRAALPFVAAESDPDLAPTARIKLKAPFPPIADPSTTAPIPAQGALAPPPLVGPIQVIAGGPLTAGAVVWRTRGEKRITAIVKATFEMRHGEAARLIAARPIIARDRWDHAIGGILPSEVAPYLPSAGVTLTGHARAPLGEPAPIVEVRLVVARGEPVLDKVVHVYGDRGATPSAPRPFVDMPLRYERAYGGLGTDNPVGTGAGPHAGALPNLLDPIDPSRAAGFGPIPESWSIRKRLLGAANPRSLAAEVPEIPVDLDWQYFQSAPADQRIDFLRGDEQILLEGVHPAIPRFETRLPGVRPKVVRRTATPGGGAQEAPLDLVADTLSIDVDRWTCSVIWRGQWAIGEEVALSSLSLVVSLDEAEPPRPALVAPPRPAPADAAAVAPPPSSRVAPPRPALVDAASTAPPPSSRMPSRPVLADAASIGPPPSSRAAPPQSPIVDPAGSASPPSSRVAPPRPATAEAAGDGPPPPSRAHPPVPASTRAPPSVISETGIRADVLARLRSGEPLHGLDLAGADLSGIDFSGAMLARLDLRGARLARCTFTEARLTEARLAEADLTAATLIAADLTGADLSRATLAEARLDRALLTDANLAAARGAGASFEGASGRRAIFARGAWEGANFSGVDLTSPDFSGASLARARLEKATLIDARLDDARAEGAVLDGARMPRVRAAGASLAEGSLRGVEAEGSIWERATLEGARFDGAKLKAANLARAACDRASFAGADLTGADLQHLHAAGADLSAAILRGAELRSAHLVDARFEGADLREATAHKADLTGGRLARADLGRAVLRGARLKRASLAGACLDGASFLDADLEEADVSRASMQGVKLGGANLKGLIREGGEP